MSNENTIECLERLQEENDELRTEVKQLHALLTTNREVIEQHGIGISFDPKQSDRDALILYWWGEATSQGYWGSVYEYKVMAEEEE